MVIELAKKTKLRLNKESAAKLFIGVIADTNRFMFSYTTTKTFDLISYMVKETNLDFTKLYDDIYARSIDDLKLQSYIVNNMTITPNGLGYIKVDEEKVVKLQSDPASITNIVNNLHNINEMYVWVICVYDKANNYIRSSIRSRGPIINEVAAKYNGGGHIYASGARPETFEQSDKMIEELDEICLKYKEGE